MSLFCVQNTLVCSTPCISEVSYISFIIQRFAQFWNRSVKRMKAACIHRTCSTCPQILFIHKCKRSIQLAIIGSRVSEVMLHASVIGHRQHGLFAGHKKCLETLAKDQVHVIACVATRILPIISVIMYVCMLGTHINRLRAGPGGGSNKG
jgi:hypothetical protein